MLRAELAWSGIPCQAGSLRQARLLSSLKKRRKKERWKNLYLPLRAGSLPICTSVHLFPRWCSGKESSYQCRRYKRHGRIPWSRKWQPALAVFAWRISWTEEPGRLQSMGSQRVRYDWACTTRPHPATCTHPIYSGRKRRIRKETWQCVLWMGFAWIY